MTWDKIKFARMKGLKDGVGSSGVVCFRGSGTEESTAGGHRDEDVEVLFGTNEDG